MGGSASGGDSGGHDFGGPNDGASGAGAMGANGESGSVTGKTAMGRDISTMSRADAEKALAVDNAISQQTGSNGKAYSENYKGTNVTNNGNAVSSGQYNSTRDQLERDYDYQQAYNKAERDFETKVYNGAKVDPNLSNMARGLADRSFITNTPPEYMSNIGINPYENPNLGPLGSSYTSFNNNPNYSMGTLPLDFVGPQRAGSINAASLLASNLAKGQAYARDANLADPFGSYLGSTVKGTMEDVGKLPGGNKNTNYVTDFQKGYNSTKDTGFFDGWFGHISPGEREAFKGKGDMQTNKNGEIGFQTNAQAFGDMAGGFLASQAIPFVGAGLDFNTQTAYGANVPGYSNTQNTLSFGLPNAVGSYLGKTLAPMVGGAIGQSVYDKTGNIENAISSAQLGGMITGGLTPKAVDAAASYAGVPMEHVFSSDATITKDGTGERVSGNSVFGSNVSKGSEGNAIYNNSTLNNNETMNDSVEPLKVLDTSGTYNDLNKANVQTQFQDDINEDFFADGSPVSLTGGATMTAGNNPLFNASPGVTYRQSGGKNRNYGSAISNAVTPQMAQNSFNDAQRRQKFGDAMLSIFG